MRRGKGVSAEDLAGELTRLRSEVTNAISFYLRQNKISQNDLAARMGVTPGRVSQVLAGDENLTLRTLATVAAALEAHFDVDLRVEGNSNPAPENEGHLRHHPTESASASEGRLAWAGHH